MLRWIDAFIYIIYSSVVLVRFKLWVTVKPRILKKLKVNTTFSLHRSFFGSNLRFQRHAILVPAASGQVFGVAPGRPPVVFDSISIWYLVLSGIWLLPFLTFWKFSKNPKAPKVPQKEA